MTDTTDFADFTDVTEDIAAYNEVAEQLTRDTAPEIPDVPEPRDAFYRLPGGLVVDGRPVYEFEVRELTGEDEEPDTGTEPVDPDHDDSEEFREAAE
jgi:hypothetical protein